MGQVNQSVVGLNFRLTKSMTCQYRERTGVPERAARLEGWTRPGLNPGDGRVCRDDNPVATAPGTDLITQAINITLRQSRRLLAMMRIKSCDSIIPACLY